MIFNTLTKVAAFDIFEIGEIVNDVLDLIPTDPVDEKFETVGMESLYFINNLGSFFLVVFTDIILCLVTLLVKCLIKIEPKPLLERIYEKLNTNMFWNSWIMTVSESYLNVCLCSLIMIKYNFEFDSFGQSFQSVTGSMFLFIYLSIPIIALVGFLTRFKEVKTRSMKS